MLTIDRSQVGRKLLRVTGAIGLALLAFVLGSVAYNEWDQARGGGGPDWPIIVLPLLLAAPALVLALRMPSNRWTLLLLALGACAFVGGLAGVAIAIGEHTVEIDAPSVPVLLLIGAALAGPSLATVLPWWRRTDEAARQAHLSGFFWGGTAGAVTVGPLLMAPHLRPDSIPAISAMTPGDAFFLGAVILYLGILVGYGVAWGVWWVRKR